MARLSPEVMAEITVRVPRGQQWFWDIIRDLHRSQGEWTVRDIDGRSNTHTASIRDFLRRLERAGYIEVVREIPDPNRKPRKVYRLLRNQPEAPRLRRDGSPAKDLGRGQEQMWRSLRMLGVVTVRDLAVAASTEETRVTVETARSYLKHLHAAGYLKRLERGRYRLRPDRNTGPLAPQVRRCDFVFDPNLGKAFSPGGGA